MAYKLPEFKNILVIHFGQLGDVVLGLPALRAIREHFASAKITVASGKSTADIIRLAKVADEQIVVDRVKLRDGKKLDSIAAIGKIVIDVRRRKFDFVVDLNSLYETNALGYLSGAKYRLYANRENRSLDFLTRFPVKPPVEDRSMHVASRYMDVLRPLGIIEDSPILELQPDTEDINEIHRIFDEHNISGERLVGIFLGAGHPSRRWPLEKYAELSMRLVSWSDLRVLIFLGPEELELLPDIKRHFPASAVVLDKLRLLPLFAALTFLDVFVGNDTGPTHLAAATKASLIVISHASAPDEFTPLTDRLTVIKSGQIDEISVDEVYQAVTESLAK